MKKKIRLSESKLKSVIGRVIKEEMSTPDVLYYVCPIPKREFEQYRNPMKNGLRPEGDVPDFAQVYGKGVYLTVNPKMYRTQRSTVVSVDPSQVEDLQSLGNGAYKASYVPPQAILSLEDGTPGLRESRLNRIVKESVKRVLKEEFSDATTFTKSLWTIVPNAALAEIKSKGGLFPYNGDTSVVTKGVYLCNDKNAIQAYCSPNSSYVEVDLGKLMSSLKGTRNANIQKRDFNGAITYIVPYVPSDCISSVEPCGRGGQLQEAKHLNKLAESDLHRIVNESVRRVLKENTEMVNNKNYVFDPSTRTGMDRTMGHDINFRYTGNDLENFTNLLRRSDGDNFNPDWLESCPGVEFDDNGYGSSYGSQQDAQELQELRNKIKAAGGMLVQGDIEQGIEKYASPATMNMIKKVGDAVVWIIELYDNEYYVSQKPYQSDESAYRACDKVLKMLGQDLNAEVCGLFYEDGDLMIDTLMYKEAGDGFWMD